jgi:hypothetical protein
MSNLKKITVLSGFLFKKPNRRNDYANLFCQKNSIHVSGIFSAHHREFSTVHSGVSYCTFGTGKFHAWNILSLICVWPCIFNVSNAIKSKPTSSWWWTKFCPKHVELILKINKHCYLMHLVGFDFIASWVCLEAVIKLALNVPVPNVQ